MAKHFAGEEDKVALTGSNDLVGLDGFGDHTYGAGGDISIPVNGFGVMDLVARADRDLLGGMISAGGDVDEVDAGLLHELREGHRLGEIPGWAERFGSPVGGGDANEEG